MPPGRAVLHHETLGLLASLSATMRACGDAAGGKQQHDADRTIRMSAPADVRIQARSRSPQTGRKSFVSTSPLLPCSVYP
jgi:hypothetical protein